MSDPSHPFTRRIFLQQGVTLASLAATAPLFIQRSALGMMRPDGSPLGSQPGVPEDHILVVVQLAGGNDGLNTVVPYGSDVYYNLRPNIAIPAPGSGGNAALEFDKGAGIGLHPSLAGFKELLDGGIASVVQGVGYPNPNRSHFTSMDIWHTADTSGRGYGWLGRYLDCTCEGAPKPETGVAIGRAAPLAMQGALQKPVTFQSAELFQWMGDVQHPMLSAPYQKINRQGTLEEVEPESQLGFLMRTALDAQISSDRIRAAVAKDPLVRYPRGGLARELRTVAAMIRDEMPTRVYYVSLGGFDTHANQPNQHGNLMRQFADALKAFHGDLKAQGNAGRVLTMCFSEFGRRVGQNASGGTDHGTAAPMYLMGEMVRPGLLGKHPRMNDLDHGDLKFEVDFRSVYTAILEDWMGADAKTVLGKQYPKARVLRT